MSPGLWCGCGAGWVKGGKVMARNSFCLSCSLHTRQAGEKMHRGCSGFSRNWFSVLLLLRICDPPSSLESPEASKYLSARGSPFYCLVRPQKYCACCTTAARRRQTPHYPRIFLLTTTFLLMDVYVKLVLHLLYDHRFRV